MFDFLKRRLAETLFISFSLAPLFLAAERGGHGGHGGHGGNPSWGGASRQRYSYNQVNVDKNYNYNKWSGSYKGGDRDRKYYGRGYNRNYYYNNYYYNPNPYYGGYAYPSYYYNYPYYDAAPYDGYYTYPSYDTGPNVGLYFQAGR